MAQAFSRPAVLVIKLVLLGAIWLLASALAIARWRMAPAHEVQQPIPFSHKHHVGDDGIDCRYCHTSVENSPSAGIPSTHICLTCHSQLFRDAPMLAPLHDSSRTRIPIHWKRIYQLPDFVYFDHSIHVNKGVACIECHGRVDQMPLLRRVKALDMQWCLACHRDPLPHMRTPSEVFSMAASVPAPQVRAQLAQMARLQDTRRLTDCSTCHR